MKKIRLNRKLFAIHSWLGLFLGIIYLVISIGGASIVFYSELNQTLYRDKINIEEQTGEKLSYDEIYAIASKLHPDAMYVSIGSDPHYPRNAWTIYSSLSNPSRLFDNGTGFIDYINPYNGQIVFSANAAGKGDLVGLLNSLHVQLCLGTGGAVIVTIVSIAVLLSIITGFVFYRKNILKVLSFRIKIKFRNWRMASSDLHRVIGTWAFFINLFIFGSGLYMEYVLLTPAWWKENWPPVNTTRHVPASMPSIDKLIVNAKQLVPEISPNNAYISYDTAQSITVSGPAKEKLFLDVDNYIYIVYNFNGELREKNYKQWNSMTTREKYDNVNFNIFHTGWAFGITGKIIWTIMGFAPAFLSLSGFVLWWRKQCSKNKRKKSLIEIQQFVTTK